MKKFFLLLFLIINIGSILSQSDNLSDLKNVNLDVLTTPGNPAFTIMGTSPSEIVEPATVTDFYASVQNASSNFTVLPDNYGLTLSPFWWTKAGKKLSFENDFSTRNKMYFWRFLRVSAGILKGVGNEEKMWKYGLGLQTNIFAGKVDKNLKEQYFNTLKSANSHFYSSIQEFYKANPLYVEMENEQNSLLKQLQLSGGQDTALLSAYKKVTSRKTQLGVVLASQFDLMNSMQQDSLDVNIMFSKLEKRIGFKWDIGLGVACDILNHEIAEADINRLGAWTNFGWTMPVTATGSYFSILGLGRYLNYEDFDYGLTDSTYYEAKHQGMIDFGAQLKFEINNKLSVLAEGIYRVILDDRAESTNKINGLIQYKLHENQVVFVSFGNAFNTKNNKGLLDVQINFGVNLGIGNDVSIHFR